MTQTFLNGTRLEALVIKDDNILLIHRRHNGQEYFVLPGGGWESPETFEAGVRREVLEETSIKVSVIRLIFDLIITNESRKAVYICKYLSGHPQLGNYNEKASMENDPNDFYQPIWLPIHKLPNTKLYTLEFRDWFLENYKNGQLPEVPHRLEIALSNFRQE